MAHVHVIPVGDLVEHTHEDCVCGPDYEYIDPETGTAYPGGVAVKHHSLDGREQTERERLGVAQTGRAPVRTGDAETPAAVAFMPCAVCRNKPAVLEMGYGRFSPCWECQDNGWRLQRIGRVRRWLRRNFR